MIIINLFKWFPLKWHYTTKKDNNVIELTRKRNMQNALLLLIITKFEKINKEKTKTLKDLV